jgi:hypothetical protein
MSALMPLDTGGERTCALDWLVSLADSSPVSAPSLAEGWDWRSLAVSETFGIGRSGKRGRSGVGGSRPAEDNATAAASI